MEWSMSSFSLLCPLSASPLLMWSCSICIVAVSRPCWLMKLVSRTLIGGVPTRRTVRRSGRSFRSGSGICAKNSANSGNPPRCVSPSFPPPHTEALLSPDLSPTGPSFGPPHWAHAAPRGSLGGKDFALQADGTLHSQQGARLYPQGRPPENEGSLPSLSSPRPPTSPPSPSPDTSQQ